MIIIAYLASDVKYFFHFFDFFFLLFFFFAFLSGFLGVAVGFLAGTRCIGCDATIEGIGGAEMGYGVGMAVSSSKAQPKRIEARAKPVEKAAKIVRRTRRSFCWGCD